MIVKNATFGSIQNNCYLVVDEKTNCSALVDCTESSQKMLDFIGDTDLKYIFLTHGHFDHTLGVEHLKQRYGIPFALSSKDAFLLENAATSGSIFGVKVGAMPTVDASVGGDFGRIMAWADKRP